MPAPIVASIAPDAGPLGGGTSVTLTGTNLSGATAVSFGVTAATGFTVNSATSITATTPAGSAGVVDVTVTTVGGTSATSAADHFTYVPAPVVTSIAPGVGPTTGGTSVTITGSNFSGATAVSFGGTAATSFTVNSATSITATSPAEGAAIVDVTVTTVGGTSATSAADRFNYQVSVPTYLTVASGTPQTATVSTAFGAGLQVTVLDQFSSPFIGATVTFTAPSSGASAVFSNSSNSITASTNGSGTASVAAPTANLTPGGPYTVTASVAGLPRLSTSA